MKSQRVSNPATATSASATQQLHTYAHADAATKSSPHSAPPTGHSPSTAKPCRSTPRSATDSAHTAPTTGSDRTTSDGHDHAQSNPGAERQEPNALHNDSNVSSHEGPASKSCPSGGGCDVRHPEMVARGVTVRNPAHSSDRDPVKPAGGLTDRPLVRTLRVSFEGMRGLLRQSLTWPVPPDTTRACDVTGPVAHPM